MKTVKVFEKFPKLTKNPQLKFGINYLVSVAGGQWFMYNASEKSIITGTMGDIYNPGKPKDVSDYKEYRISTVIPFEVSNLIAHPAHIGLCLLWGRHGIAVVNIPVNSKNDDEIDQVKGTIIGEDLYMENVKLKTIQVKWHPSGAHKAVVALHSDFKVRLYTLDNPCVPLAEIGVGPPVESQQDPEDVLVGSELEVPTDIDFGPHLPKSNLWIIFVLQESGAIYYILIRALENIKRCYVELHGPLRAHDEVDDNLGVVRSKYTSLVVTKNFPIVITTGDLSNTLQHFLLLPDDFETEECVLEEKVLSGEMKLYLREKIILETISETDLNYLQLIQDPAADHRYVCVTETGVYLICVNFIPDIRLYVKSAGVTETLRSNPSTVRFLICWKVSDKSQPDKCLAGLSFCDPAEQKLLIVLGDLRAVLVDVNYSSYSVGDSPADLESGRSQNSASSFAFGSDFQDILKTVKTILKKDATQPLMCSPQEITGEDLEKFTIESLDLLAREYMERQEEAVNYLDCAISTVQVKTETMCENLEELLQSRVDLRQKAETIAEQYDEAGSKNEQFQKRLQTILHKQQQALPAMTDQEKQWRRTLEEWEKDVEIFKSWILALREKARAEKDNKLNQQAQALSLRLTPHQIAEIKSEIMRQHETILRLTKEIREMKQALGVP